MNRYAKHIKLGATIILALVSLYLVSVIFVSGQILLASAVLAGISIGFFVYLSKVGHTYRYLFPGLAGIAVFIVFPLIYTVWVGFTNYSSLHLLTYERAVDYFLDETYRVSKIEYQFSLHADGNQYRLLLVNEQGQKFVSPPLNLDATVRTKVNMQPLTNESLGKPLSIRDIIQHMDRIKQLQAEFPDGTSARMTGLRNFAPQQQRYRYNPQQKTLEDLKTGDTLTANFNTGYFENSKGGAVSPGFRIFVGTANFMRMITDPGFQGPFIRIFIWTVMFAGLTVLFTLIVGSVLAVLLSWEALKFRGVYRMMLFMPYAVPGFISILVFKGLFNENFGEINIILNSLFGIKPAWFSDPILAKSMLLIVNTWLGYPYIMVLCMGLLKSIPGDLYEASAIAGAGPITNFFKITIPLIIRPLTPLLISSFAFNFNNFVLIALLTNGRPDFLGTKVPAGTTDILVSYTYRIAFEDSGKDFGLAGAIATVIFFMVAILAIVQLHYSNINVEQSR